MGLGYEHRGSAMGFSGGETPPRAGPSHRLTTPSQNFAGRGPPGGGIWRRRNAPHPASKFFGAGNGSFRRSLSLAVRRRLADHFRGRFVF
jgi:hypothetical protein